MSVGEPAAQPPAPPIAGRRPGIGRVGALAIAGGIVAIGLPLAALPW